jgi:hypothetical protein
MWPGGAAPVLLGSGSSGSITIATNPGVWSSPVASFNFGTTVTVPMVAGRKSYPVAVNVTGLGWLQIDGPVLANAVQLNNLPAAATGLTWLAYYFQPATSVTAAALLAATLAGFAANISWITPLPTSWSTSQADPGTVMQMAIDFADQVFSYSGNPDSATWSTFIGLYVNAPASLGLA